MPVPPDTAPKDDEAFYLEPVTLDDDDDDEDYAYEEVEVDEGEEEEEGVGDDEDLEQAIATLRTKEEGAAAQPKEELPPRAAVTRRPEVLDDFIRNVLLKMGMSETLDMFQREWYRLTGEGKLSEVDMGTVPDIYLRNQQLGAPPHRRPVDAAARARAPPPIARSRAWARAQATSCATCRRR